MTESTADKAADVTRIMCPYCGYEFGLKERKPGKFAPTCRGCSRKFVFSVPPYDDLPIMISPLKSQLEAIAKEQEQKQLQEAQDALAKESQQHVHGVKEEQARQNSELSELPDTNDLDMTLPSTQIAGTLPAAPEPPKETPGGGFEILDESFLQEAETQLPETPVEAIGSEASPLSSDMDIGLTLPSSTPPPPTSLNSPPSSAPATTPEQYEDAEFSVIKFGGNQPQAEQKQANQAAAQANALQNEKSPSISGEQSFSDILNEDSRLVDDSLSEITAPSDLKRAEKTSSVMESARERYKQAIQEKVESVPSKDRNPELDKEIPNKLGGYDILDVLGKGGMGAVYKARQLSLDRIVAIKVIHEQWADDPQFLSRFVREAYAAAQLTHHNVVQIYDIAEDQGINFFSMEYVKGQSIKQLIRQEGRVDAEVSAGYILQACRGLKYAHDRGMVHRDIKPDNLMLNDEGVVKVADLGLVKTPGLEDGVTLNSEALKQARADITSASIAMGTPAYMAPEQAEDAANVDHRADIYSLGCTFYVMLTGKPPFEGKTAAEVLTKHATEQIVAPELIVKRVPKVLSAIIHRMVAKAPEERYGNIDDLIQDLEEFLGIDNSKPFTPKEQHAALLEDSVSRYNDCKSAKYLKRFTLFFFYLACLGMIGVFSVAQNALMVSASLGLGVLTAVNHFILDGLFNHGYLFKKLRQQIFSASIRDWITWLFVGAIGFGILHLFDLLLPWLGVYLLSLGIAAIFTFVLDRKVKNDRQKQLVDVQLMLKKMRLYGLEENHLRAFVCKYAGKKWEGFYEDLFGFEDKITARERWGKGDDGKMRPKTGAWREPFIDSINNKLQQKKEAKAQKHLAKVQRKALKAAGKDDIEANKQARDMAQTMVSNAAAMRVADRKFQDEEATMISEAGRRKEASGSTPKPAKPKLMKVSNLAKADAISEEERAEQRKSHAYEENWFGPLGLVFGARVRFILAIALIGICALWAQQNDLIKNPSAAISALSDSPKTKPLALPGPMNAFVPVVLRNYFLNNLGIGFAGLIFLASCFLKTRKIVYLSWPACAAAFFLPGILSFIGISLPVISVTMLALIISGSVTALGVIWKR